MPRRKGGFSLVQCPFKEHRQFPPARRSVRAQQARVLRLFLRESQRSGAQARYTRKLTHEARAKADSLEHGLAPKEGGC